MLNSRGQRIIYTTPLKALSNQKLFEMRERFGSAMVGLQTGDASLNVDSAIVVMTTEVLRNIMYRTGATGTRQEPTQHSYKSKMSSWQLYATAQQHYVHVQQHVWQVSRKCDIAR